MKQEDYRKTYATDLAAFLRTPAGMMLPAALMSLRPTAACKPTEHETVFASGYLGGYERCLQSLIQCSQPFIEQKKPEATYGATPAQIKNAKKDK